MPAQWIRVVAGLAFVGFGFWTVRGDTYDDGQGKLYRLGPFVTVATTFFLSELGDKTMLATVTLATQLQGVIGVWLGSTVGMVAADALAILVGQVLGRRLPARAVKFGAAAIFLIFGGWLLAQSTFATA